MKRFALSILFLFVVGNYTQAEFSDQTAAEQIPFRLHRDYMVLVEGSIGSLDKITFLVDTGATSTIISPFVAKKLKLKTFKKDSVAMGIRLRSEAAILQDIQIGSTRFRFVPAVVTDLSALPKTAGNIDAVLGMDALVRTSLRIDYGSRTLAFRPQRPLACTAELAVEDLKPCVTLRVGRQSVRMLVDSGAEDLVLFRCRLKKDPPKLYRSWQSKPIRNLGGTHPAKLVSLPQASLGPTTWEKLGAYLMEEEIKHYRGLQGFVGPASLGWTSVQFDFSQRQLSWDVELVR